MRKVKTLNQWGIYENNPAEITEYGFKYTVLHPDNMEYPYMCNPADSDMEFDTLEAAVSWIENYDK